MLGKRSRFRRTGSCMSELGSKLSFPSTECTREKQSPRAQPDCSADGPNVSLLQSVHSLGAPSADVGKEAATDTSLYKIGMLQNGPELMCFEGASLEDQGQCLRNNVREGNWNSSMLVPLAVGRVDPQEALLECSETQTVFARDSQFTEWHRNTRPSISLGVSSSSRGPHTFQTVPSFLDACFLCKKRLGPRVDIFMYRGDAAFCSDECREHQMSIDERREQASLSTDKMASGAASPVHHSHHSGGVVPADTAAAVAYVGSV